MSNKIKKISIIFLTFLSCIMIISALCLFQVNTVYAAEVTGSWGKTGITVTNVSTSKTLQDVVSDPDTYKDNAENGQLVSASEAIDETTLKSNKTIIFTAKYPYTTTKRSGDFVEYTVQKNDQGKYIVTAINTNGDGTTYIPVKGYVLSIAKATNFTVALNNEISLGGTSITIPDKAIDSSTGNRVAVDLINGNRSKAMCVYYDYDFGTKTGTNVYGTEVAAVYNKQDGKFIVTTFRAFGEGDASGMIIPDNGFVLSFYGEGYRGIGMQGKRFNLGDQLTMVGFDYIRFGDTITWQYDYVYGKDTTEDWIKQNNPDAWETSTSPFPAYRGTDQTIVYEYGWSYKSSSGTGTNVYGYEVAVDENGVVTERNVNVSSIPENGFVISGHGKGRDFIRSNIPLGATITINKQTKVISITTSLNSYFFNTKTTLESVITSAQTKLDQLYDVNKTEVQQQITNAQSALETLKEIKEEIELKDEQKSWASDIERNNRLMDYNDQKLTVENYSTTILSMAQESKAVSARAVWHRPTEKTLADLTASLDTYKDCGINLIFLETFYNGYSMFKSDYVDYHKDFVGTSYGEYTDYVKAFTALAEERGIEVHAWVEDFYVGLSNEITLLKNHPDWIMYNDDGTIYQRNEGGKYIFIDPTNSEVCDFLITYYKEMLEENPLLKGINLDYIRYPVSTTAQDTGYTKNSMMTFATQIGISDKIKESMTISEMIKAFRKYAFNSQYTTKASENLTKWDEYRLNAITNFVKRINSEVKSDKDILLSTAVFSSLTTTKEQKKQDWQTWIKKGWIDIATPMAYYDSSVDVLKGVKDMIAIAGSYCYYYTGLASSYRGMPAYENANQIEASYMGGANGYVIFCSTQILGHEDVQAVLKAGVNSQSGVLPHSSVDKVLEAYFTSILTRATQLYMPANQMTQSQYEVLNAKFATIKAMPYSTVTELKAIKAVFDDMQEDVFLKTISSPGNARARLREAFTEISNLFKTKINRFISQEPTSPKITFSKTLEYTQGATDVNLLDGVVVSDDYDSSLQATITNQGGFDVNKVGTYTITYSATNSKGKTSTATRVVTVKATESPAKTGCSCGSETMSSGIIGTIVLISLAGVVFFIKKKKNSNR